MKNIAGGSGGFGLGLLISIGLALWSASAGMAALVEVVNIVLSQLGSGMVVEIIAQVVRWAVLTGAVILALGLIYRVGPDREAPAVRWLSLGSVIAAVIWIAASVGFSFYVDNFGRYGKTNGALAGVVVLLIWFWITALVVPRAIHARWVGGERSRPTNLRQRVDLRLQVQCTSPCAVSSS